MKRILNTLLIVFAISIIFMSCDNDDHATDSRSPEFGSLTLSPSTVSPGDSVTASVSYVYPGKKIYSSVYTLSISGNTSEGPYNKSIEWKVVDPTRSTPVQKFAAPETPGIYTVVFRASRINFSSGGPNGELYGSANSVNATLRVVGNN